MSTGRQTVSPHSRLPLFPVMWSAFSRSSVDVHGSCDQSHHLISSSSVMACHFAACTDDRGSRMGLIYTTAERQGQICDGVRKPHIPPAQRAPSAETSQP